MADLNVTYDINVGDQRSAARLQQNFVDIETKVNGNIQTSNIADAQVTADKVGTTAAGQLGLSQTGTVRRGKCIIPTDQTTAATSYAIGNLATPDRVQNVVVPTDGLLFIAYRALLKAPTSFTARAAIFIGANQLKIPTASGGAPVVTEISQSGGSTPEYSLIGTHAVGLTGFLGTTSDMTDVTTGQALYTPNASGSLGASSVCVVDVAAGTYDISVQYLVTSGTLNVKERKLWVWTQGF